MCPEPSPSVLDASSGLQGTEVEAPGGGLALDPGPHLPTSPALGCYRSELGEEEGGLLAVPLTWKATTRQKVGFEKSPSHLARLLFRAGLCAGEPGVDFILAGREQIREGFLEVGASRGWGRSGEVWPPRCPHPSHPGGMSRW